MGDKMKENYNQLLAFVVLVIILVIVGKYLGWW